MRERPLVVSIVGGLLGGLVGAAAMSAVHTGLSRVRPPDPPPPQAREDDSTVKVADALSRTFRDAPLPESAKPLAGLGGGLGFGAAVWLGAHVVTVPALGLAPSPRSQPRSKEGLELALHLLFGVCTEQVRRVVVRLFG